jgi:hypothetical protein
MKTLKGFTPEISFNYLAHRDWENKTILEIYKASENIRKAIKEATNYFWDNSHFYIRDISGIEVLQIGFYKDCISFWNAKTGDGILSINNKTVTHKDIKTIDELIENIHENKRLCLECGKWVSEGKRYSFAGFVCQDCYNPETHLPPDTRGD